MPGVGPTLHEFEAGTLHSGRKRGPLVTNRKQAIAIGLNSGKQANSVGRRAVGMVSGRGKAK